MQCKYWQRPKNTFIKVTSDQTDLKIFCELAPLPPASDRLQNVIEVCKIVRQTGPAGKELNNSATALCKITTSDTHFVCIYFKLKGAALRQTPPIDVLLVLIVSGHIVSVCRRCAFEVFSVLGLSNDRFYCEHSPLADVCGRSQTEDTDFVCGSSSLPFGSARAVAASAAAAERNNDDTCPVR